MLNKDKHNMRKLVYLVVLLLVSISTSAQSLVQIDSIVNMNQNKYQIYAKAFDFTDVTYLKLSKAELWSNLKSWVASNFNSRFVIEDEDKEMGRIIINYNQADEYFTQCTTGTYHSSLQIDVREGRYRVHFFNQYVQVKVKDMDYSYLPSSVLRSYREDLESIERVAHVYFNDSLTWPLKGLENKYSTIGSCFTSVPYKVEKMNEDVYKSLQSALRIKDDF